MSNILFIRVLKSCIFLIAVTCTLVTFSQPTNVTVNIISSGTDTYVTSAAPTTAQNGSGRLYVGWNSTGSVKERTLISADLSSIPTNAIIVSATLNMYAYSVDNTLSHPIYISRSAASWTESSVTWNTQPAYTTTDQLSFTHASTSSTGWHSFNVLSHVQYMVNNPTLNYGWFIRMQTESGVGSKSIRYRDSEQSSFTSQRPYLSVTYILPIEISGTVTHCTEGNDDGSITNISITEGTETYSSYEWLNYNMGTVTSVESGTNFSNINLDDVADGLYMLRVTDNGGYSGYQYFLVGEECTTTTVEFSNSNATGAAAYNEDAHIQSGTGALTNYGSLTTINSHQSNTYEASALIRYKVNFDPVLIYETANLYLDCANHYTEVGNTNESYVYRVTSQWYENAVVWATQPTSTTTDAVTIPGTTPTGNVNRDDIVNLLKFVNYWSQNPTENHGIIIDIDETETGTSYLSYFSTDYTTYASRPKLVLTYTLNCPTYYELAEIPEGSYYQVTDDILRVKYIEEYIDEDNDLTYKITNASGTIAQDQSTVARVVRLGDNRLSIDVSGLSNGFYTLEITNEKNEKWYLRFEVV